MYLYSKEKLSEIMLLDNGNNGELLPTVNINRPNRFSDIYIKCEIQGKVIPTVQRSYYDDNQNLIRTESQYPILDENTSYYVFTYDPNFDNNHIAYRIWFECIQDSSTVNISEMGLIFDEFEISKDNELNYISSYNVDINDNPLDYQTFDSTNNFTLITGRNKLQEINNIVKKPYYLVDIKDGCIDNSSNELSCTSLNLNYVSSATKLISVQLSNIVGNL